MSFNGSGVFNINSTGQPVVYNTVIDETVFNALTADLATGLTTCLTKDGQSTPTANITMGGFKLTSVAVATTTGDALSYGRAAVVTSLNGLTVTTSTGTLTIANGKTLTASKTMQLTAADDTGVYTLPTGTATILANDLSNVGTIVHDLLFTDATYDIGKSGATRPRDVFASRNLVVGGTAVISGTATCQSTFTASGAQAFFSGISTTASAANAFLDNANSNNLLRSTSSIRYKTDVQYLSGVSEIIDSLRPMTYRSLAKSDDPAKRHYGLLAEEVAKVEPALVQWTKAESVTASDDYFAANAVNGMVPDGVQYERLVVLLIAKVQSLEARLKAAGIA